MYSENQIENTSFLGIRAFFKEFRVGQHQRKGTFLWRNEAEMLLVATGVFEKFMQSVV